MFVRFVSLVLVLLPLFSKAQLVLDSLRVLYPEQFIEQQIDEGVANNQFDQVADGYKALSTIYFEQNKKEDALKALTKSIQYYGILDDSLNYHQGNLILTDFYLNSKLYKEALELNLKALRFFKNKEDRKAQLSISKKLAEIYRLQKNVPKEYEFLKNSLQLNNSIKDTLMEIQLQIQKANWMKDHQNYEAALDAIYLAANHSKVIGQDSFLCEIYFQLGVISQLYGENQVAKKYMNRADSLYQLHSNAYINYSSYKEISDAFMELNQPKKAYAYLNTYLHRKDSLDNQNQLDAINQLIVQYQQEQQKAAIKNLQEQKVDVQVKSKLQSNIITSILVGVIAILIGLYLIIRFYQQQISAKETITIQKEEINRQRIVDLENNLKIETMQSMLAGQEAERERVAKDLHDSLGGLLSTIKLQFESVATKMTNLNKVKEYNKANIMLDEACQEVRNISNNMQPGALLKLGLVPALKDLMNRFQGDHYPDIDFQHYGLEEYRLDNTTALMLFRIIQELLNNSIKYAKADEIFVQLTRNENEIIVTVEDDGIGYDPDTAKKGMGTENINSRVNYLKGELNVHSIIDKGTSTMINIPL